MHSTAHHNTAQHSDMHCEVEFRGHFKLCQAEHALLDVVTLLTSLLLYGHENTNVNYLVPAWPPLGNKVFQSTGCPSSRLILVCVTL